MRHAAMVLTFCSAALVSLGLVALFSSKVEFQVFGSDGLQVLWCSLGLGTALVVAHLDYRWLKRVSWLLYGGAVLLLVAVLVSGVKRNGATRWLEVGPLSFQPSEVAKLALVVVLACYVDRRPRRMAGWGGGLIVPGLITGVIMALVFLEPDWGTTLLLAGVSGVMLVVGGGRWTHLIPVGLAGLLALGVVLTQDPTRLNRVVSWLHPEATKEGVGSQAYHAKLALGSGGLTGTGLGSGEHYGYVAFNRTDFIFALLGEELGLAGALGVVLAFVLILVCGVVIAWHAPDIFGMLLATGLTFMIGLQALINLGVVTSLLPNKGMPLPFVSKGGSNLFMMLVFVGILLSIARTTARERAVADSGHDLEELPASQPC